MGKSRLKQIRLLSGYSQAEVSKNTHIHFSKISRLETGLVKPNERHRSDLAQFFKVDPELIFPSD